MQVIVRAEDGDQIAIAADEVATEQAVIKLGFEDPTFNELADFDGMTLTIQRARELASALLTIADAIESYHASPWNEPAVRAPDVAGPRLV
jgi:hypothetical protein